MSSQPPARGWARVEQAVKQDGPLGWPKQNLANTVSGTGHLVDTFDPALTRVKQRQRAA